jgi:hypothetical protein
METEMEMEFCKKEMKTEFFGGSGNGNGNGTMFFGGTTWKWNFRFRLMRHFRFMVVLHGQSSKRNTRPCETKPPKQPLLYSLLY